MSRLEAHFLGVPYVEQGVLYLIEIEAEDELFLKAGISKSSVQDRYAHLISHNFYVTPLREIRASMSYVVALEREIKKRFTHLKYLPLVRFAGKTECYSCAAIKELTEFFDTQRTVLV